MSLNIVKPTEISFMRSLIFGGSGLGKTVFLGTANDFETTTPMLLLDFEGGSSSLRGRDIDVVRVRDWNDYNEAYHHLSTQPHPYKSVGIDSVTETQTYALMEILRQESPNRKDDDVLQQQDYGKALIQLRKLLRSFRDLEMHVFFTALAQDDADPREGLVKKPSLAGKMADEIPGIVDVVAYLSITDLGDKKAPDPHRVLILKNYPRIRAKSRTPHNDETIPDEIIDPTVEKLFTALKY
jgi:phage nucleotide-binding protein